MGGAIKKTGFTLIELLVTITIIALLTGIAATSYVNSQRRSRDSARKSQVNNVAAAVESFYQLNKRFPGKINTTTDPLPAGLAPDTYNLSYANCQGIDTSSSYFYVYYPLPATANGTGTKVTPCNDTLNRPVLLNGAKTVYDPSWYNPYPGWIPELGSFLNPPPLERNYRGADGSDTGDYYELVDSNNGNNLSRTLTYRKLQGGYAIYVKLENSATDLDALATGGGVLADSPAFPNGGPVSFQNVTNTNIYMVRR